MLISSRLDSLSNDQPGLRPCGRSWQGKCAQKNPALCGFCFWGHQVSGGVEGHALKCVNQGESLSFRAP